MLETMRITTLIFLGAAACPAWADDMLWKKLETEADLVVLMRHTQPAGGNPLTWDESGNCRGESMLTAGGEAHAKRIATIAIACTRRSVTVHPLTTNGLTLETAACVH